jgi:glycosyltransferase involved in cell wall biosynthesis
LSPLVTVCINNFNYAPFLPQAIDSVLAQTYAPVQVVVVDDGSIDGSREVIARYGDRIVPVLKDNGGQASAFNAGVARSCGEIVCFLDSDDHFAPDKVARVVDAFPGHGAESKPIMVHHQLTMVGDNAGSLAGRIIGRKHASPLNLYDFACRYGFLFYMAGPTSCLSLNRALVDRLFPVPEDGIRTSADDFIVMGASLIGDLYSLDEALGSYRIHGENAWFGGNRQKPEAFRQTLDRYLNDKLVANGLQPVVWSDRSMNAWPELSRDERWKPLLTEMLKLSALQHGATVTRQARAAMRLAIKRLSETEPLSASSDPLM